MPKNFFNKLRGYFYALFYGMKNTEDIVFHQNGVNGQEGTVISQEVNENRVSKALLKGEVTQEVKELRYRTYKVDREAKGYEYYAPTLAFKRDQEKQDNKFVQYENSEGLEIVTIQENYPIDETVADGIGRLDSNANSVINYTVKIDRGNAIARYRLEAYTNRLAVKKIDETNVLLDFYVSKYPNSDFTVHKGKMTEEAVRNLNSKGFVREIEKIMNDGLRSDIIEFNKVKFVSHNAYKINDMLEYEFKHPRYKDIVEYDGNYIIKFQATIEKNGVDLMDKYYCEEMEQKYKNKEKKDVVFDISGYTKPEHYYCEECGKEIIYDPEEMDLIPISMPKLVEGTFNDVEEVYDNVEIPKDEETNTTEYMDLQMAEQTFGKRLCKDCLKKYLEKNNLI